MHAAVWRALCTASRAPTRPLYHKVAGIRSPSSVRNFKTSATANQAANEPSKPDDAGEQGGRNSTSESSADEGLQDVNAEEAPPETLDRRQRLLRARGEYGAARRRTLRKVQQKEVPPLILPPDFLTRNVYLSEHSLQSTGRLAACLTYRDPATKQIARIDAGHEDMFIRGSEKVIAYTQRILNDSEKLSSCTQQLIKKWTPSSAIAQAELGSSELPDHALASEGPKVAVDQQQTPDLEKEIEKLSSEIAKDLLLVQQHRQPDIDETIVNDQSSRGADDRKQLPPVEKSEDASADARRHHLQHLRSLIALSGLKYNTVEDAKYTIDAGIYSEIVTSLRAALTLTPPKDVNLKNVPRPVTSLQCPKDGGSLFLDAIVQQASADLGADLIRIDPNDIAEIMGGYIGENLAWTYSTTSLLGYEAQRVAGHLDEPGKHDDIEFDDQETSEDDNEVPSPIKSMSFSIPAMLPKPSSQKSANRPKSILALLQDSGMITKDADNDNSSSVVYADAGPSSSRSSAWTDLKISSAFEAIVEAAETLRSGTSHVRGDGTEAQSQRPLIIQVRDYKELSAAPGGAEMLTKLRDVIKKRWVEGQQIIMVGTTSAEDLFPELSRAAIEQIQSDIVQGADRTIIVTPDTRDAQVTTFQEDQKSYTKQINIRHLEDMIRKLAGSTRAGLDVDITKGLSQSTTCQQELEDSVWSFACVHRLATTILGLEPSVQFVNGPQFEHAFELLEASDRAKFMWVSEENHHGTQADEPSSNEKADKTASDHQKANRQRMKDIRKTCTPHEKKLLGGVVDPADLHTTFADVRAPPDTIEALKTLTTLSLVRPEAFSYGVLATDKIPGLLLYGPPGTGKTLLAKAVAKESGATVLEVSGSDMYDMYVGEGEKNVKALFSLAKKLTPCVVFIDEADAIFGARGDSSKRTSHRELINQFLREWDGMNNLSAFIMVATNRPFDLDEAVLRRLPRRLLVDLPLEKDREAILKIHLKDEVLDESVSLADLAKQTPFYSGSDLKNLSVAAALACIREENAEAAKHTGAEPYVYPKRRILAKRHFDKAMEEISASVSEDMSTLSAIRKFDERFGDRKGRRKKSGGLGFGLTEPERDSDAARVRQLEA
jgi:ATP-dependent 26S proteasome regulatory subunit